MNGFYSTRTRPAGRVLLIGCVSFALFASAFVAHNQETVAQDTSAEADREASMMQRYLQVLLRRPRPGVALDRVYGYHVQNDSLGELEKKLTDPAAEDAGARQMVWGLIQLQRGRAAEAATILSDAESKLTDDAACSYYLGRAYLAVGQTEQAAAAMERAIERGPSRVDALPMFTELGRIYSRAGQSEKSLAVWTRLEALFPGDTRVGGQIARTLAEEGNFQEARLRYEKLSNASRKPDEKIAFAVQAAEMRRNLGDTEDATKVLEKILSRLRPGSWLYTDVRNRIEAGFTKSGDYDALADYYKKQLETRPNDLLLRTRLSRIMITAGRLTEAKELLETAVQQAPDDTEARLTLIDVLVNQSDIASASKQFAELAKRDAENPDHIIRWGQVLLEDSETPLEERRSEAAAVWARLAESRNDDPVTLSQVADRLRSIDRTEDAIKLYRKSIELDADSPQYREYLGEYLHSLGRKDDAVEVWQSIASDDRRDRDSLVRLAEVFGAFGFPARALESWEQASAFDMTFAQELRYAVKLSEAKRYEDALARLDLAAKIAETPDEQEQLLHDRIEVYQSSGTLEDQIQKLTAAPESVAGLRTLAMMYGALGDLVSAERSIQKAITLDPDAPDVLLVAADLAERQNRFGDAAKLFERLATTDNRFRTNYLQRVASLQSRLGQTDKAIETCEAIIDANPASPESYLFYARTAFGVNRDEEGIAALRRAMSVAPRDNSARRMLASHFADRYRTDEAIELYWQAFNYENATDDKIEVIRSLASLYDRKTDLDALIGRIEEINRKDGDPRTTQLMTAAAYESVQDYGAARSAIDQLLATKPRDVALLETMVRLSDAADEVELAAEFQKRINELADTPENRFKLIQFQLESGTIDVKQALSQRLSFLTDPSRLGNMVRSAASRGDLATAMTICREALRADDSLWDIKLTLAQLLLQDPFADDAESNRAEAIKLATDVRNADVEMDAAPPTRRKTTKRRPANNQPSVNYMANPMYWSQSSYQLASMLRIGQYASQSYSYSRASATIDPTSFGHARVIAASLILMNEAIGKTAEEAEKAIREKMDSEFNPGDIASVNDAMNLWEQYALMSVVSVVTNNPSFGPFGPANPGLSGKAKERAEEMRKRQMAMMWRLAEVDPNNGLTPLLSMLAQRLMSSAMPAQQKPDMTPLTEGELETLARINEQVQTNGLRQNTLLGLAAGSGEMIFQSILGFEFQLAGLEDKAAEFAPQDPGPEADFDQVFSAIQFYLRVNQPEKAKGLIARLLPAARKATPKTPVQGFNPTIQMMMGGTQSTRDFYRDHQKELVDAVIAKWCRQTSHPATRSVSLGDGYINAYTQIGGGFRNVRLRGPLSPRLMDSALAQEIMAYQSEPATPSAGNPRLELPTELIEHLENPSEVATKAETKTRKVVAAYAHWWSDRPEKCYDNLVKLCEEYPADVDLQIERARLASELKQPRLALEMLDVFSPLDSRMLVRKEMAAMNLAAEVGDTDRAKLAAERLFGMRLDIQTQLALADQLKRLGLDDQASAMLQRTRSGRIRDENTQIQVAQAFLRSGNQEAAAEVAYSLLRRLSSGRSRSGNHSHYQRQVVSILQSAGRLEPLIERAKRRVETAPKAIRPKQELAELYIAAGRAEDANKVWETLSDNVPVGAPQLIARADALAKASKNAKAVELYLDAFEKDPSRFNNDYYKMTNAARSAGDATIDKMFQRLMKFPVAQIPTYRMDELARLGSRNSLSDAKRDFIGHLLKSPAAKSQVFNILRNLPADQKSKVPEYRQAVINAICSDDAFLVSSTMWQVNSRGSGGRAIGPLADTLKLLQSDEDAAKQFKEAATKALENEAYKRNAQFLLAILGSNNAENLEGCMEKVRESIRRDPDDESNTPTVSYGLLWQGGQVFETDAKAPTDFLLEVYLEAKRSNNASSGSSPQYTLDSRIADIYIKAGRKEDARQMILALHRGTDYSSQNQYNPGYGDYQQLQSDQWAAEKLVDCDAPIDALIIYRTTLSDAAKFDRAQRWGGSQTRKQAFETGAERAAAKISAEVSAKHLTHQVELWEEDLTKHPVELMECSVDSLGTTETPSSIALALRKASGDEKTKAKVEDFVSRVEKLQDANSDSWQLAALNLMACCYLGHENNEPLTEELFKRLPDPKSLADENATASVSRRAESLYDLYTVTLAANQSKNETDQGIGKRLAKYLSDVAASANDSSIALALAEINGDAAGSVKRILDLIEAQTNADAVLPESTVNQCLDIAKDAAKAGEIDSAVRALRLALRNGPPLRKISTGGDAFAISSRSRSTSSSTQIEPSMQKLIEQVSAVSEALSKSTGVPLSFRVANSSSQPESKIDKEAVGAIADAYLSIFVPRGGKGSVFTYSNPIATQSYDRIRSDADIVVSSASMALASAAAYGDRLDEVTADLEKLRESKRTNAEISVALVQLAIASRDPERLHSALAEFTSVMDSQLPDRKSANNVAAPVNSISSQMATDSRKKSLVVDTVVHAIWPVIATDYLTEKSAVEDPVRTKIASQVGELIQRTRGLINSDGYTANRHREIQRRLSQKYVDIAKAYGNTEIVDDYVKSELASLDTQNYPSGTNIEDYKRRSLERLTTRMIDDEMTHRMDEVFRRAVTTRKSADRNYSNRFEPHVCLAISRLPLDKRVDLLERISFGRSGDQPFAYVEGLVSYEVPPTLVRRQHPWLEHVLNLQTSTKDYPIVNSYLMLIDSITESGDFDEIRNKLAAQSKSDDDEPAIASALLELAAAKLEGRDAKPVLAQIHPTLNAVAAKLAKNLPQKNDKTLSFPGMETHLILRAVEAGLPVNIAEPMIRNVKTYAIRGQRNFMVSAVARATAKMGVGRAANATVDSPLEHFDVVAVAARYRGDNHLLPPLYAATRDGWLSGTSGYEHAHLMFKYPLAGEYTFSAEIQDGAWGEADVAYGGVIYQATGWQKTATLYGMNNRGKVEVKVESIEQGKVNSEGITVSPDKVEAICNGKSYVTDVAATSFPFASVIHQKYRTTRFRNVKFSGNPTIPDEVNLIHPTMRGWGVLTRGNAPTKMLLPIGPKQNRQGILNFRKGLETKLAKGPIVGKWSVREDQLHYKRQPEGSRTYDPAGQLQYARPLQEGESISLEFYWKAGETEFAPTVGRTIFRFGPKGTTPDWIVANGDLASVRYIATSALEPAREPIAPNNRPKEDAWNQLTMKRSGDIVKLSLNGKPLAEITVVGHERPGIYRIEKTDVIVRSMKLTGPWPDQFPKELLAE